MSEKPTGWLSDQELARVAPADEAAFDAPVPTQIVSNGEFNPMPQTEAQRQVEGLVKSLGDDFAKRQGLERRDFLRTASGMATAFLAMNQVFGPVWDVTEAEAADRDVADARARELSSQFIFDVQTHFVRDDYTRERILVLAKYASEHWNPDIKKRPMTIARMKFENYLREVFMDSDTKLALLSSATFDNPDYYFLFNDQIRDARSLVNSVAGSKRLFAHTVISPGQPGWLDEVDKAIVEYKPDSWKGYTTGDPSSPTKAGSAWRLDDEKVVYPFYEKAVTAGITTICIHKGLLPRDYEQSWKDVWRHATVWDVAKAAKDWPQLNFVIYHSAVRPLLEQPELELAEFEKTGWIRWSTDLARIPQEHGVTNVYAEIGSAFANSAVANPRFCAAFLGQLVNEMGVDHVLWGTDSVWYGSPQWQIEALRRLEIPEDMAKRHGWKVRLGAADGEVKRQIFGLNAAKLYNVKPESAYASLKDDHLAEMKRRWVAAGEQRSNRTYGFVAKDETGQT